MDTALLSAPVDPSLAMGANAGNEAAMRSQTIQNLAKGSQDDEQKRKKLREACEGFEAVFIQQMWQQMRASLPKDGLMSSKEEEFWQGMYDQELGKSMASAGGIGLADMMMEQLDRNNQALSDAGRTGSIRRMPMEVTPAPLLPAVPPKEGVEDGTASTLHAGQQNTAGQQAQGVQAGQAGQTGQTGQAGQTGLSAGSGMYDGEAAGVAHVEELAPAEEAGSAVNAPVGRTPAGQTAPAAQAPQEMSGEAATNAVAEENSPLLRQTLDELASQVAQREPQQSQNTGQAQAPTVTRTTYTTNLPPSERQLSPVQTSTSSSPASRASQRANQMPLNAAAEGPGALLPPQAQSVAPSFYEEANPVAAPQGQAAPMSAPVYSPAQPLQPAPTQKPGWPSPEKDILAGIHASYMPRSQKERVSMYAGASLNPQTHIPTHAGGPRRASTPVVANPAAYGANPAPEQGSLATPLNGSIGSGFGWRLDPFTGQRAWHEGVDIKATEGQSVQAAKSGTVIFAGYDPELGNTVILDHGNDLRTIYGHNKELSVTVGQKIEQGTEIATAGSSGRAAGTHLHFEIRRGELSINPEPYISQGLEHKTPSVEAKVPLTSLS